MQFTISTEVPGNYEEVMGQFDRQLFEHLKPVGAKLEIVAFTGSQKGDKVHLRFTSPIKAEWISKITEHGVDESEAYFIDEGEILPGPLRYWKHKHIVRKIKEDKSLIVDQIEYKTANRFLDALIYPAMYLGFYPRKRQYQNYFK